MKSLQLILILVCMAAITGCATIVKGKSQTVTVDTKPPGAICTLTRDGETVAVVSPTPGSIAVDKSGDAITVTCKREGYQDSTGLIGTKFQAMTFGNVIFGGIIGAAVDAGSGAMHEYEPIVTITLIPFDFESIEARDAFFDKLRSDFLIESEKAIELISQKCEGDTCEEQLKAAETAKQAKLEEIENKRKASTVEGERRQVEIDQQKKTDATQNIVDSADAKRHDDSGKSTEPEEQDPHKKYLYFNRPGAAMGY